MLIRLPALLFVLILIFIPPACSKYTKIKSGEVSIELQTPSGISGRGIGNIFIFRNRKAKTWDNAMTCKGTVPSRDYHKLIKELNLAGFMFRANQKDSIPHRGKPFSLRVTEFQNGKTYRSNTVYWTGNTFRPQSIMLILNKIRHALKHKGTCRGNLSDGRPCIQNQHCRSSCCKISKGGGGTCADEIECDTTEGK